MGEYLGVFGAGVSIFGVVGGHVMQCMSARTLVAVCRQPDMM
jgi:hypothetical protein